MTVSSILKRIGLVLIAAALLALSGTMAWAAVNDYTERTYVTSGVSVAGTDLSGMTEDEARTAIERTVSAPLLEPVSVTANGSQFTFDPTGVVTIDVEGMLDEAFSPRRSASYIERLRHDLTGEPIETEIEPKYSVDEEALDEWVAKVADQVDHKAVSAKVKIVKSRVKIVPETIGAKTDIDESEEALKEAFSGEQALSTSKTVELPVKVLEPKTTADEIGKTIVVDLSEKRIRLFDGDDLEVTYPCAIGTPSHPTPTGHYKIVQKRYMPTWINPAPTTWGKDMPARIAPGVSNPLGTRALNLSAPGIRFHGTTNIGSVGTAASHGCMRMRMADIEDFYDRVKVGTQVYIVP